MSRSTARIIVELIPWLYTFCLGYLLSTVLVQSSIHAARRFEVLARPSDRGSHSLPTPRLGGLGAAMAFYLVVLMTYRWWSFPAAPWNAAMIVGAGYALVGGTLDDVLELNPRWKFLFQFAAAGTAVVMGFGPQVFRLSCAASITLPALLAPIFTFLFIVFMMNAYNFMDGMDGQASVFGIIVSLCFAIPLMHGASMRMMPEGFFCAALAGVLLGLLMFNYPGKPQGHKTFMGDCGSQFVGFLLAVFALRIEEGFAEGFSFAAAIIVLSPFVWDVCYTLVRRLSRGENVLQAHRSHLYQRLLIAGWSHAATLVLNTALWLTCFVLAQWHVEAGRAGLPHLQWYIVLGTLAVLVAYTMFVLDVESRARRRHPCRYEA